jgi:hypothetical protein
MKVDRIQAPGAVREMDMGALWCTWALCICFLGFVSLNSRRFGLSCGQRPRSLKLEA